MRWNKLRRRPEHSEGSAEKMWALDLETTGLEVGVDHIIEIALIPIYGRRIRLGDAWSTLVRPVHYRDGGTAVHGLRAVDLHDAPDLASALDALWDRMGEQPALVVHHAAVDIGFLKQAHTDLGLAWPEPTVVDTVDLIGRRNRTLRQLGQPELPFALGQARRDLGLPPASEHRALDDAIATAELWLALTANRSAT